MSLAYRILWYISWPFLSLVLPRRSYGRENIPEGPVLICANHASKFDAFFIIYAAGPKHHIHFLTKEGVFRVPIVAAIMRGVGMIPVEQTGNATQAVKSAMRRLKEGRVVGIFPEGARIYRDEDSVAKTGAVRLAVRMGVPIVPVYIPRKKRYFRRNLVVIGKPYTIDMDKKTAKPEDYDRLTDELMETIRLLGAEKQ